MLCYVTFSSEQTCQNEILSQTKT